jgi:hypothetical protein
MYKEPHFVIEYYQRKPPKCCFTCDYFLLHNANCSKFNQVVPEIFAREIDKCEEWQEMYVPF